MLEHEPAVARAIENGALMASGTGMGLAALCDIGVPLLAAGVSMFALAGVDG